MTDSVNYRKLHRSLKRSWEASFSEGAYKPMIKLILWKIRYKFCVFSFVILKYFSHPKYSSSLSKDHRTCNRSLHKKPVNSIMKSVAMIINARWVVPVVPTNTVYDNYSIVIDNERIIDIIPTSVREEYWLVRSRKLQRSTLLILLWIKSSMLLCLVLLTCMRMLQWVCSRAIAMIRFFLIGFVLFLCCCNI